jgi:hypothetical protein
MKNLTQETPYQRKINNFQVIVKHRQQPYELEYHGLRAVWNHRFTLPTWQEVFGTLLMAGVFIGFVYFC